MKHFVIIALIFFFISCKHANNKDQTIELAEKIFVVNTVDNQKKLQEYLQYHKKVWPQVEEGFKKAGYKSIALYHFKDLIVMRITFPKNADLNKMGVTAEAFNPRCAEWNRIMNAYQKGVNGTSQEQTWVEAVPFYKFSN